MKKQKEEHAETHRLTSNMEDYLEAISIAGKEKGVARVKDIRDLMSVKTPSVTGAVKFLSLSGFVTHEKYGYVELTPKGVRAAESIKKRHELLSVFLQEILKVNRETAEIDACKMEHALSKETFVKLQSFVEKLLKKG